MEVHQLRHRAGCGSCLDCLQRVTAPEVPAVSRQEWTEAGQRKRKISCVQICVQWRLLTGGADLGKMQL